MSRNNTFLFKLLINDSKDPRFFFPALLFSDEKKFDVEHHFNTQNDQLWPRDGDERSRVVTMKQCGASLMIWAAIIESGRSPLVFVD